MKEEIDIVELSEHIGTDLEVRTDGFDKPLYAKLISVGTTFCTFERLNGRLISINKQKILQIQPIGWAKGGRT